MKKRIIALAIAVALLAAYGCRADEQPEAKKKTLEVAEVKTTPTVEAVAPVVTPAEVVTPTPTVEATPTPEPTPEITYNARLYAYVIPEPEPEPEIVDACFDEDVQTGEYHEDVPQADSGQYLGDWTITFYCTGSCCNGGYTGTASGAPLTPWHTCACTALPFGTVVYIEGVGTFVVEDTGVSGNWIDCCVSSHDEALALGMRTAAVYIVG